MPRFLTLNQCFLLILFFMPVAHSQDLAVQVVVNSSVPSGEITMAQAKRIFSMRQTTWSNDTAVTVYVLEGRHPIHQIFSTQVLGLFPYQLDRIWNKLVFSGLGEEPIKVQNEQEMLDRITKQPGSIGYLTKIKEIDNANVKIIRVIKE